MNRTLHYSILLFTLFLVHPLLGQRSANLNNWLRFELDRSADGEIDLFVKGDLGQIQRQVTQMAGTYKFGVKNIASVRLSKAKVEALADAVGIDYIAYYNYEGKPLYDNLTLNNNLDSVHQNLGDLPMGLTGKGVVVGIIDNGLDWQHPDFQHQDGSTRIRYLWDQRSGLPSNLGTFNYGFEWDSTTIDNGSIDHNPEVGFGHGTGVSGLAIGNGNAVDRYIGAAPDAEIVFVNIGDGNFVSQFVDGMEYIFEKAEALGMPCVINSSLGYYGGAHDTRGLDVQLVENILNQSPGRVLVQACGNGALTNLHLSYNPGVDTSFSWMRHTTTFGQVVFEAFADEADFNDVWLKIGMRRRNTFEFYGETPFVNFQSDFNLPNNYSVDSLVADLVTDQDSFRVKLTVQRVDGVYEMLFEGFETNNNHFLELTMTGNGDFDIWSHKGLMGTSTIVNQASLIPDVTEFPAIASFVLPDTLKTIVGGWNCSPEVISVANWSNADSWDTWNGGFVENTVPYQELVWDSSTGPTRTGDQKPDIGASGNFTFSAATLMNLDNLKLNFPDKVSPEGWHASFSGTSAAAPVVAGAVACYLELFPETDHLTIKSELEQTAKVDSFVLLKGASPNYGFGYGKLDAYQLIRSSINYGCTDPEASNYDSNANFDDGSCDFSTAILDLEDIGIQLQVQPNPTADQVWVNYDLGTYQAADYRIFDHLGRQMAAGQIENAVGQFALDLSNKAPGLYLFQLSLDGNAVESIKLIRK